MTGHGGPRERIKITPDKIKVEVNSLKQDQLAPLQDAVAERLGITGNQLREWLHNHHTDSTGSDLGVIPRGKVTEVLCLSLGEQFKKLGFEFTISDFARILQMDPSSLHHTLGEKPGVMEALKKLGLVNRRQGRRS